MRVTTVRETILRNPSSPTAPRAGASNNTHQNVVATLHIMAAGAVFAFMAAVVLKLI